MDDVLDQILPYVPMILFALLGVFVVFGMLFGMGRGLKRSALRLVIFAVLLLVAFFLTPVITNALLGIGISIAGKTPNEWVDDLSGQLIEFLQDQFGNYITPFNAYIKDYAVGIVLAVANLVLFLVLYLIVKVLSWIIYAIVARFVAPKRDADGNKKNKHMWWGLLVGALQGIVLFVFFMIPVNGVIGVVNQAAHYQTVEVASDAENALSTAETVDVDDETDENEAVRVMKKVDDSLAVYQNVLRFSGVQFLTNKAFEYQLTVRVKNASSINLVQDINTGWELYVDTDTFIQTMDKFGKMFGNGVDLTLMTAEDYEVLRLYLNKVFDLQILKVADRLLSDLDKIFNTPLGDSDVYLDGTEIYADSFYGKLIQENVTGRGIDETTPASEIVHYYAEYAEGLRAVVNYIADQKLNLLKNDVLNMIDFVEAVGTYKITYQGLQTPTTAAELLARDEWALRDYLNVITAELSEDQGQYKKGTPFINVLGDRLKQFSLVQMIGVHHADNLVTYGNMFENQSEEDTKNFLYGFVALFLGDNAFNHTDEQGAPVTGNWEKLGNIALKVARVLRDYCTIADDIEEIKNRLISEGVEESSAQFKAVLEYLGNLVITKEEYAIRKSEFKQTEYNNDVKFQKVDNLVDAVYEAVNTFPVLKDFLISRMQTIAEDDETGYAKILINMLGDDNQANWRSTFRSIVGTANLVNNSPLGDILDMVQNADGALDSAALKDKFMDMVSDMTADDIGGMIYDIISIDEIGGAVQDILADAFEQIYKSDIDWDEVFGEGKGDEVQDKIENLQQIFAEENVDETKLKDAVKDMWDSIGSLLNQKAA